MARSKGRCTIKITNMDVIIIEAGMKAEQTGPTSMQAMTKTEKAVAFRFEITADEIELLRLSREEVVKQGEAIARALLAFAQAEDTKWEAGKEDVRKLDS